jgi:hypothetical protein
MEGTMRLVYAAASVALVAGSSHAQQPSSQDEYMKQVMTAAPSHIVKDATIVRRDASTKEMKTLKTGSNGFSCLVGLANHVPMCMDANAMAWEDALRSHAAPPDNTGFIYMMAGDSGASNTDPWAAEAKPGNHWVQTGSHVMIVGAAVKTMQGYPRNAAPDPTEPYIMWPGTPYEHLMIPVK